ncbi:MAG: hypothetical protein NT040_14235 [Bacteroidetes bacterium]|nr:hypothetical protein [Bacteroidota bacterium]
MKRLLYIPMLHNQTDLGSLGGRLSIEGGKKYGISNWQEHVEQVDKSWHRIDAEISRLIRRISPGKIKIYQDGLPAVDEVGRKIVQEAAKSGSINYRIIDDLMVRGAKLEIAENKELLLREYFLLTDIAKAETPEDALKAYQDYQKVAQELLNDRDTHIANQINATLANGETGIAFFGAAHAITGKLNKDIKVTVIQMFTDDISRFLLNNPGQA